LSSGTALYDRYLADGAVEVPRYPGWFGQPVAVIRVTVRMGLVPRPVLPSWVWG